MSARQRRRRAERAGRRRRSRVAFLVAASTAAPLPASAAPEYPWPRDVACPPRANIPYRFDDSGSGGAWTNTEKNRFRDGANAWDGIFNEFGAPFTDAFESSAASAIPIRKVEAGEGNSGVTHCPGGVLESIDVDISNANAGVTRGLAAHEIGHGHGLSHSGTNDPTANAQPTMSTCNVSIANQANVETDDFAQLAWQMSQLNMHANQSFENGSTYWTFISGSASVNTNGGSSGPRYVNFRATASGANMFQDQRVHAPMSAFSARAHFKSSSSGSAEVQLRTRRFSHNATDPCGDPGIYYNDLNLNETTYADSVFVTRSTSGNCTVFSSWNLCTTGNYTSTSLGEQVRVQVFKATSGDLQIDNVRAYDS